MITLNKTIQKIGTWELEEDQDTSFEQICLNLHHDTARLWFVARKENTQKNESELRKYIANVLVTVLLLFVKVKRLKNPSKGK